jgi:hypothetical protein
MMTMRMSSDSFGSMKVAKLVLRERSSSCLMLVWHD